MKKLLIILLIVASLLLSGCNSLSANEINCDHLDTEDDGICDLCEQSLIVVIDFYAINDLHGKFADSDTHPGVDELTTYLKNAAATDDHTVFLSSGDMWQGSSESNMTNGLIITDWMNELNFVSMTMGNHEYDWGENPIIENAEAAEFPFLAINIYDRETNERVSYCESSVTVERGGVKIGIIGAIGDCYSSIAADKAEDVYFKVDEELAELVKAESQRLREDGANIIVYSLHDGYDKSSSIEKNVSGTELSDYYARELSREGYVDLVFEAHTHQRYVLKDTYGVYHLQGGGENMGISHVELGVNYITDSVIINEAKFVSTNEYTSLDDDPIVSELLNKYEDEIAEANQVLGTNKVTRDDTELEKMVAELYYRFGVATWGDEYEIVLGGGFLRTRSPYDLAAGEVTYADLQSLFPFDNNIVLCSIKGSDLLSRFINNGSSDYHVYIENYDTIDPEATYYIVTDSYCSTYAPNRLTEVANHGDGLYARDLLAEYIESGGLE